MFLFVYKKVSLAFSEQEMPLRHREYGGGFAGEEGAVGAGFAGDVDGGEASLRSAPFFADGAGVAGGGENVGEAEFVADG